MKVAHANEKQYIRSLTEAFPLAGLWIEVSDHKAVAPELKSTRSSVSPLSHPPSPALLEYAPTSPSS